MIEVNDYVVWGALAVLGLSLFVLLRESFLRGAEHVRALVRAREERHRERLEDLFLPQEQARAFALLEIVAPVVVLVVALMVPPRSPILAVALAGGVVLLNRVIYGFLRRKRRERLENDLPEALSALANGARAGLNLEQALQLVAREFGGPVGEEIGLIVKDIGLGTALGVALERARRRVDLDSFSLTMTALSIAHDRGGNLVEIVEEIEKAIREIHRLELKIKSETANVRLSAKIMAASPVVFLVMFRFIDPEWNRILFGTVLGNLVLVVVAVLVVVSYAMVVRLANPDL